MKKMLLRAAATIALIGGLVAAGAAPAQAATTSKNVYCGSGWASIQVTNYSSSWMSVAVYNASTGAHWSTVSVAPYAVKSILPALHNARFVMNGPGFGYTTWCG